MNASAPLPALALDDPRGLEVSRVDAGLRRLGLSEDQRQDAWIRLLSGDRRPLWRIAQDVVREGIAVDGRRGLARRRRWEAARTWLSRRGPVSDVEVGAWLEEAPPPPWVELLPDLETSAPDADLEGAVAARRAVAGLSEEGRAAAAAWMEDTLTGEARRRCRARLRRELGCLRGATP